MKGDAERFSTPEMRESLVELLETLRQNAVLGAMLVHDRHGAANRAQTYRECRNDFCRTVRAADDEYRRLLGLSALGDDLTATPTGEAATGGEAGQ